MRELLGAEARELEESLDRPGAAGLRVNTLKVGPEEFRSISPWNLEPVPWCPSGFFVDAAGRPGLHPFHLAGLYYLQEPSAMAVAEALAPRPGERVLDLAAAPGGKTTHLAALLADEGLLVANDVHGGRARELSRNLERWGSRRTLVTSAEIADLARAWGPSFDAVLLDAPCSGEGMFRKSPEAVGQWSPELVTECSARQETLLAQASRLVRPGGRLAYSTCTFEPEENEQVVAGFLAERPDWSVMTSLATGGEDGVAAGRPEWAHGAARAGELSRAVRLWPHRSGGEGHFVVLLQRSSESEDSEASPPPAAGRRSGKERRGRRASRPEGAARDSWHSFVAEWLTGDPLPDHEISGRSDGLYALPPGAPDLSGVRSLRPGLWLGATLHGRFVPSHALALALRGDDVRQTVDLALPGSAAGSGTVEQYLVGLELEVPGEDGWVLVTVAGHPLGWGKRARGIVKNHYPKGLRRSP